MRMGSNMMGISRSVVGLLDKGHHDDHGLDVAQKWSCARQLLNGDRGVGAYLGNMGWLRDRGRV